MAAAKLTNEEARRLLEMLKRSLVEQVDFPLPGDTLEFDVVGDTTKDRFIISIYRGRIKADKVEMGARIKVGGVPLLELHVSPTKVHLNPDGKKIIGSHWHLYTEEHGRRHAYPAEDIQSECFVENTLLFLERFNVIQPPNIQHQLDIL